MKPLGCIVPVSFFILLVLIISPALASRWNTSHYHQRGLNSHWVHYPRSSVPFGQYNVDRRYRRVKVKING